MLLLDTNAVSELRKVRAGKAEPRVAAWGRTVPGASLYLSVIVVQELEIDTLQIERRDPTQGALLRAWLDEHVLSSFADRILPVDAAVARRSAALHVPDPRPYPHRSRLPDVGCGARCLGPDVHAVERCGRATIPMV